MTATSTLAHPTLVNLSSSLRTSGHGTPNHGSRSNTPLRVKGRFARAQADLPTSTLNADADATDADGLVRRSMSAIVLDCKVAHHTSIGRQRRLSVTTFNDSETSTPRAGSHSVADAVDVLLARQQLLETIDSGTAQHHHWNSSSPVMELQVPISQYAVLGPDSAIAQAIAQLSFPAVRCLVVAAPGATHILSRQDVDRLARYCHDPLSETLGSFLAGTPPPPAVYPSATAATAGGLLLEGGGSREYLAVVEDGPGSFVGLLSRTDITKALLGNKAAVYDACGAAAVEAAVAAAADADSNNTGADANSAAKSPHTTAPPQDAVLAGSRGSSQGTAEHSGSSWATGPMAVSISATPAATPRPPLAPPQGPPPHHHYHHPHVHPHGHIAQPSDISAEPSDGSVASEITLKQAPRLTPATAAAAGTTSTSTSAPCARYDSSAFVTAALPLAAAATAATNPHPSPALPWGDTLDQLLPVRGSVISGLPDALARIQTHLGSFIAEQQQQHQQHQQLGAEGVAAASPQVQGGATPRAPFDCLRSCPTDALRSGWDMLDNVDDALDVLGLVGKTVNAEAVGRRLLGDVAGATANIAGGSSTGGWAFKYLYDGDCSICRTFQALLEKLDNGVGRVAFVDISSQAFNPLEHGGINYKAAMETMHILSANGQVFKGVTAAIKLVAAVDADVAAHIGALTAILPLLSLAYMVISKNRHRLAPIWAQILQATKVDQAVFGRSILEGPGPNYSDAAAGGNAHQQQQNQQQQQLQHPQSPPAGMGGSSLVPVPVPVVQGRRWLGAGGGMGGRRGGAQLQPQASK